MIALPVTPAPSCAPDSECAGLMLAFNHSEPTGAGGLAADVLAAASAGVHVLPISTAVLVRDTAGTRDLYALPTDVIEDQVRAVLEDMAVKVAKLGFGGSPEALAMLAEVLADYPDCLLLTQLPDLSWWESNQIERYLDALRELLLPQSSVLVGNRDGLQRWLLPDRADGAPCTPRDLAAAAAEAGCPYVLVTGMAEGDQIINVLASPNSVILQASFERIDSHFVGAGDTLSASLAAILALGASDLAEASQEALTYLDRSLAAGFTPGMGRAVPDRLFWADDAEENAKDPADSSSTNS